MRYRLFILLVLASVSFFNYHGLVSDQLGKLMFYLCVLTCLVYAVREGISLRGVRYPRVAYGVLLAGICGSVLMGSLFHSQSLRVSAMTTLPFLMAYGTFWILLKMDLESNRVMRIYLWLCAIATVVYFCNVLTLPHNIFGVPILDLDETRGVIRIPVVFIEFFPMVVFYAINRWIDDHKRWWWVVIAVGVLMIVLSVIRQIILLTAVLGLWFFLRNVSTWKKLALIAVAMLTVVYVLPMIPMYKTMIELSEDHLAANDETENIRITAWRWYTIENQTNALSPIFGNGIPSAGNSLWGRMFDSEIEVNGCFVVDVGWAGFFWYFGGLTTLALLALLLRALFRRKSRHEQYLNYWIVFLIITSVASGPLLFYWQILDITVCLAMVFTPKRKDDNDITAKPVTDVKDSTDNTQLQPQPRYPQLR